MTTHRYTTAGLLLAVALGSCSENVADGPDRTPQQRDAGPPMPADFTVAIGSGGGFAGTWSMTEIAADGKVTASSDELGSEGELKVTGRVSRAARREIWQELHRAGFFTMRSEPANMSTAITVTAGGRSTHIAHEIDAGPPAFSALVAYVFARARKAEPIPLQATASGLRLAVRFETTAASGPQRCQLELRVENASKETLRVPNGRSVAAYMDAPFGLDLELRAASGERFFPDPGAGGPALPIGADHFTELHPGEWFMRRVAIGGWFTGNIGAGARLLWDSPGQYTAEVRWHCPEGMKPFAAEPDSALPPIWHGATEPMELAFEVR